jgi:hypothetical protein
MKKDKFENMIGLPNHEIESLARCFLPYIRGYYKSEEGQRAFEEWELTRKPEKPDSAK